MDAGGGDHALHRHDPDDELYVDDGGSDGSSGVELLDAGVGEEGGGDVDAVAYQLQDLDSGAVSDVPPALGGVEDGSSRAPGTGDGGPMPPTSPSMPTAAGMDSGQLLGEGDTADAVVAGHAEVRDPKTTAYTVFVVCVARVRPRPPAPPAWTIFRRYRDFLALHDVLKKRGIIVAAPFPGKRWISVGPDDEFLAKRRQALTAWLSSLLTMALPPAGAGMPAMAVPAAPASSTAPTPPPSSTALASGPVSSNGTGSGSGGGVSVFHLPEVHRFLTEAADVMPKGLDTVAYKNSMRLMEEATRSVVGNRPPPPPPTMPQPVGGALPAPALLPPIISTPAVGGGGGAYESDEAASTASGPSGVVPWVVGVAEEVVAGAGSGGGMAAPAPAVVSGTHAGGEGGMSTTSPPPPSSCSGASTRALAPTPPIAITSTTNPLLFASVHQAVSVHRTGTVSLLAPGTNGSTTVTVSTTGVSLPTTATVPSTQLSSPTAPPAASSTAAGSVAPVLAPVAMPAAGSGRLPPLPQGLTSGQIATPPPHAINQAPAVFTSVSFPRAGVVLAPIVHVSAGGAGTSTATSTATPASTCGPGGPSAATPSKAAHAATDAVGNRGRVCLDDFELLKVIGKGSFGKVLLVRRRVEGGGGGSVPAPLFAMKVLSKANVIKRKQVEHTITERRVLGYTRHPFIIQLHYAFQTKTKLFLVVDYAGGGELFFHLGRLGRFNEGMARFYAAELVLALGHLHRRGVAYRDLKPENVLLDHEGHVKLADFGLSKEGITDPTDGTKSFCGTPEYLAPEVLNRTGHGHGVDWWSLGALIFEMLTGLPPWYTRDRKKLYERLRSAPLEFPPYLSKEAQSLISGLLTRDPAARLGARRDALDIQAHPWFGGMDWHVLYDRAVTPPFIPQLRADSVDVRYFDAQFTDLPPTVQLDDDKVSPPTGGGGAAPVAAGGGTSPGRTTSFASVGGSASLFSNFTYEGPSLLAAISRASRGMSLSHGFPASSSVGSFSELGGRDGMLLAHGGGMKRGVSGGSGGGGSTGPSSSPAMVPAPSPPPPFVTTPPTFLGAPSVAASLSGALPGPAVLSGGPLVRTISGEIAAGMASARVSGGGAGGGGLTIRGGVGGGAPIGSGGGASNGAGGSGKGAPGSSSPLAGRHQMHATYFGAPPPGGPSGLSTLLGGGAPRSGAPPPHAATPPTYTMPPLPSTSGGGATRPVTGHGVSRHGVPSGGGHAHPVHGSHVGGMGGVGMGGSTSYFGQPAPLRGVPGATAALAATTVAMSGGAYPTAAAVMMPSGAYLAPHRPTTSSGRLLAQMTAASGVGIGSPALTVTRTSVTAATSGSGAIPRGYDPTHVYATGRR